MAMPLRCKVEKSAEEKRNTRERANLADSKHWHLVQSSARKWPFGMVNIAFIANGPRFHSSGAEECRQATQTLRRNCLRRALRDDLIYIFSRGRW